MTAYLFGVVDGANRYRFVQERSEPVSCDVPSARMGTKPVVGNHLLFDQEGVSWLRGADPKAAKLLKPFIGSREFLQGKKRWILHLEGVSPSRLAEMPIARVRVENVRTMRAKSRKAATRRLADYPTEYEVRTVPQSTFLAIPKVSSMRRDYAPIDWLSSPTIPSDLLFAALDAQLWHFAILSSAAHMAWLRNIGGRLKSDYRYSLTLVYNTFPWPALDDQSRERLSLHAQDILDSRAEFPDSTLAQLYDPDLMPPTLRKAHQANDRYVDRLYRKQKFQSERERVEHLFGLYEKMIAPIEAEAKKKPARRKKRQTS